MKNAQTESATLDVDVFIWRKICKLATILKSEPEEVAAFFLLKWVQPTHKKI